VTEHSRLTNDADVSRHGAIGATGAPTNDDGR